MSYKDYGTTNRLSTSLSQFLPLHFIFLPSFFRLYKGYDDVRKFVLLL